jgi:HEPN domain-containing protein
MLDLDENLLEIVDQWAQKAESDLKTAEILLRVRQDCPTDIICFHVQQCVEKYVKAMLVLNAIEFPPARIRSACSWRWYLPRFAPL